MEDVIGFFLKGAALAMGVAAGLVLLSIIIPILTTVFFVFLVFAAIGLAVLGYAVFTD
jgi:hypothetical protein